MTTQQRQEAPAKQKKKTFAEVVSSYVPTNERTYNYAIPTFAFALSCFSFGCFLTIIENWYGNDLDNTVFNLGYLTLAAASNVELYYGLSHRSRRQFTFWLFLKVVEVLTLSGVAIKHALAPHFQKVVVPSFVFSVLNIILFIYVARRSTRRSRTNLKTFERNESIPSITVY